jgi:hypothetical protein
MCLLYRLLCGVVRVLARGGGELRRWHRALLAGGRRRCRRRPGRPPLAAETRGLIRRLARENPRWGYMRIEGVLLKLGIGVLATTIASVLRRARASVRRRGGSAPSWSEFLRAQAHSLVGGGLSSALGGDGLGADAAEPGGPAPVGEARQVEADENRSLAAAAEPRLASRPLPERRRSARSLSPRRLERHCARRHRIDRTLATDPQGEASARPTSKCSKATSKPRLIAAARADHAPHPPCQAAASRDPRRRRNSTTTRAASSNRISLPHTRLIEHTRGVVLRGKGSRR